MDSSQSRNRRPGEKEKLRGFTISRVWVVIDMGFVGFTVEDLDTEFRDL